MCKHCHGSGWIVATHRKSGHQFSFGCDLCDRSARFPRIPRWGSKHAFEYETDFQKTVPDNKAKAIPEKQIEEDDFPF